MGLTIQTPNLVKGLKMFGIPPEFIALLFFKTQIARLWMKSHLILYTFHQ